MLNFSVTFLITLINLGVLFVLLRLILFKPVTKFMAQRQEAVKADIDAAAKQNADAARLKADYEARLAKADEESAAIIQKAHATADRQSEEIIRQAQAEAQALETRTEQEMVQEKEAAQAQFQSQAVALVLAAAAKLLQRQFTDEDSRKQAALFLREVQQGGLSG